MIKKLFQFINQNTNFLSYSSEEKQLFLKEYSLSGLYLFSQDPSPFIRLQQRRKIEIQQQRNQELKGIMRQLVQLLQPLNDNYTIPAFLFLKGPLLGELLYDPSAIRNTSDIDIFISLDKVPQAFSLLGANGFTFFDGQPLSGDYFLYFLEEDASGTIQNSHFRQITNGTHTVEIHGALFKYAPSISVEEHIRIGKTALKHVQQIQSEEFQYPFLDMTDLLIQLCYHFARHFIDGIHYIACEAQESYPLPFHNLLDIALLLEHAQNQLDISEVVTRAENYHCLSTTLFTLKCIEDIFDLQAYKMLIEKLVQENLDIADITSLQPYITDEEDLFFFRAIELLSIRDIFSQNWSNVLDKIRRDVSPIRRYFCNKSAKQAFKMHCKSNVSAAYSFNWKVYCHPMPQKTSLTLEWQIFNRDIYLNEPSTLNIPYAQSPTEPSMGKSLSPVLGFVFSSNKVQFTRDYTG